MNFQNNLETSGNLQTHSFAELLVEIARVKLNGSLRLAREAQKIAVYFDAGEAVFAVSNAREHRIYEILLRAEKITKEHLVTIPEFTNDLALKEYLSRNEGFEKKDLNALFSAQITEIFRSALAWRTGEWVFSPLVRIKGDLRFAFDLNNLLVEHARLLPPAEIDRKFTNLQEFIRAVPALPAGVNLTSQEFFVFSRFENDELPIEKLQTLSGLPEPEARRIIYTLLLGGALTRENRNPAFSEKKLNAIASARLSLKKDERATPPPVVQLPKTKSAAPPETIETVETQKPAAAAEAAPIEEPLSLEEYLDRVEKAANFYEMFALAPDAAVPEIKKIYFGLAKRFHPDLYHKETDAKLLQRVQTAFTKVAHAYDTLKTENTRGVYDFRMRKELAELKAIQKEETTREEIDVGKQNDQAEEHFKQGFGSLVNGDYEAAIAPLARAAHFGKGNARYHAYYGKALAADARQRHKAESELQTAVKLDGANADYRMMLAEFFVQFNLLKRAEGELNRLLAIAPNHREAKRLLDSLPKK